MKKIGFVLALVLTLAMLIAMTGPAFADASGAVFAEGSSAGSYDGSLFTAGGSVDSSAEVRGVQFAAGSDVQVQGSCEYLMAAGNQLVFSGGAENDAFAAGNNVYIFGSVGRDLFAAGSTVEIRGSVERSAYIAAGSVVIDGSIGGDLYLSADKVVISDSTKIGGTVHYGSNTQVSAPKSVLSVAEVYEEIENAPASAHKSVGSKALSVVLSYLGAAAVAFVLLWLTPIWEKLDSKYYGAAFGDYARAFGIGFAVLAGLPVAAVLLMITRIGLRLAFVLLLVYAAAIVASPVFLSFFIGMLIWRRALRKAPCYFAELPIGLLAWRIVYCVPGLSFITGLVAVPLGLGVLTLLLGKPPKQSAPALPETE